jgi:alkyl hydroperoxide reductase subunit AhpC
MGAARAVFVVNPAKKVALTMLYPASTGRNFDELLRVVDSLQLTANYSVCAGRERELTPT